MAMEKRGVVDPKETNDIEHRRAVGEKRASNENTIEKLDDDFTKRAADKAADSLKDE